MSVYYCNCGNIIEKGGRGRPAKVCESCRLKASAAKIQLNSKTVSSAMPGDTLYQPSTIEENDNLSDFGELLCANPGCGNVLVVHPGRGRKPKYCEKCKKFRVSLAPTMLKASRKYAEGSKCKCATVGCYTPVTEGMFCDYCKASPESKNEWASILCSVQGCPNNIYVLLSDVTKKSPMCCYHSDIEALKGKKETSCTNCNRIFRYTTDLPPVFCEFCTAKENFSFKPTSNTEGQDITSRVALILSCYYNKTISPIALNNFCKSFVGSSFDENNEDSANSDE